MAHAPFAGASLLPALSETGGLIFSQAPPFAGNTKVMCVTIGRFADGMAPAMNMAAPAAVFSRTARQAGEPPAWFGAGRQQSRWPYFFTARCYTVRMLALRYDEHGLIPAIAQQHDTGEVLMMAWMNREAVAETLATRRVCYYSRSRKALWRKGETSGQTQRLVDLRIDCDADTLLLLVDQKGVACHTGRRSCFFRAARYEGVVEIADKLVDPSDLYG